MREMTTMEVLQLLNNGEKVSIIDVREYEEVQMGKIPEAKNIPLGELARRKDELEKNEQAHIIVCQSGNRSKAATGLLENMGYKAINMVGGMNNWKGSTE
ncbi:rhodanese-like domain-containing protein [Bacillus solimangrovi]|uniref:Sulfurtransferase n=1 Tax=Bacillus solimangrovi TaxID=1305675 RepID=A0A1E5LEP7_9BACI|nr:rhodanese-like domain-containing protein [Bacillus solimangrovi]OEH92550.1 sulfurtransferase [Bacillus solimangrovi]